VKHRAVLLLSLGHAVTDINQGALPALLPFLIAEYGLSYAAAAFVVFAANSASTVVQPLFGHLADRVGKPWLLPASVFVASVGVALVGVVSSYAWVLAAAIVSGIGVAAYHPEGARRVHSVAGDEKGMAMSVFGIGGTVGFAVGPALITAAVLHWGLGGSVVVMVPACLTVCLLLQRASWVARSGRSAQPSEDPVGSARAKDAWGPFVRLTGLVIGRATIFYSLNTFIPLYVLRVLRGSAAAGATALTLFALAGVLGNLLGGKVADRMGHRSVAVAGFCLLVPLIPVALWVPNQVAAMIVLMAIGACLASTYSPVIILGQQYLPNHIGLSSGVTLGIAVAIGGVTTPILGRIADLYSLWHALAVLAILPVLSVGLALTLPPPARR